MNPFNLPDLGEGLDEAEVVDWHVEVGDHVVAEQPLLSVETDKAVVEIPSPVSGTVEKIHVSIGEFAKVGAPLIEFDTGEREDKGSVVGALPQGEDQNPEVGIHAQPSSHVGVKAMPAVRALATKMNIYIADVAGTGAGGSITAQDIKRVAQTLEKAGPAEPLRGVRRAMARKMTQSHAEVVPASIYDEVDISDWPAHPDVSVRLIKAIATACEAAPSLNAWYDGENKARRLIETVDLGIAANTNSGLFVPVMRDVANRDARDLRTGLNAMKKALEARDIPPEEMRGATITLSNFGVFGAGRFATLVVVPPQVAIVGTGLVRDQVCAVDGVPIIRKMLPLSLTFDHRVVTGAEATAFLVAMLESLKRKE
ncbi:MAG: 2-oxo acid dehydrogenase subunit E2 [Magnetovibrio sp.]|nr:2-oxo acid dehydrogenase subunit E2 [Magnetovibrio sp.]